MEKSRTGYVLGNLISSLINSVIGTILPFLVRTLTIKYLGSEYMGLNNLCTSILYVLNATDLGIANAFAYKLYKPMADRNTQEICKLLNFYKRIYFAIGMIIFIAGMCLMPFLTYFISSDMPQGINIYFVFFLYLINSSISYTTFSYKNLIFKADQRGDYIATLASINFLLLYGSQIILIITKHYYISVIMYPLTTLLENLLRNYWANKKYPDYIPKGNIEENIKKDIKKDVLSVAIYKFRDISRNTFDNIVISTFSGLVTLSNYQNYYTIFTVPNLLLTIFYGSFVPSVGNYAATNNEDKVFNIYHKNVFIQSFLAGWFAICYGFLIDDCIELWLGVDYHLPVMVGIWFAIYILVMGENFSLKIIRESVGLWNYGRQWAALEMISNLILNVVLMKTMGVEGVILATIISVLFISVPAENYIVYKYYFKGKFRERLKLAAVDLSWIAFTIVVVGVFCYFAPDSLLIRFIYKVLICVIVPIVTLTVFFYKTDDFKFIIDILKLMLRRIKIK